jgi:hypothetical protein
MINLDGCWKRGLGWMVFDSVEKISRHGGTHFVVRSLWSTEKINSIENSSFENKN